jgi:hypothetical protein
MLRAEKIKKWLGYNSLLCICKSNINAQDKENYLGVLKTVKKILIP